MNNIKLNWQIEAYKAYIASMFVIKDFPKFNQFSIDTSLNNYSVIKREIANLSKVQNIIMTTDFGSFITYHGTMPNWNTVFHPFRE